MAVKRENDRVVFGGGVQFIVLPSPNADKSKGDVVLAALNKNFIALLNTVPVTVTNITGGSGGRPITLLGDGFTTIKNNAILHLNTGADKLLAANKIYTFTNYSDQWFENE